MTFPDQNDDPDNDDDVADGNDAGWGRLSYDNYDDDESDDDVDDDDDANDDDDIAGGNNDAGWLGLSHANVHTGNAVQPANNQLG